MNLASEAGEFTDQIASPRTKKKLAIMNSIVQIRLNAFERRGAFSLHGVDDDGLGGLETQATAGHGRIWRQVVSIACHVWLARGAFPRSRAKPSSQSVEAKRTHPSVPLGR